jgi:regulator-associated protein of mTOR
MTMIAVRVQQQEQRAPQPQQNNSRQPSHTSNMSPSRSRPQSYASPGQGQTTPTQNGTTNGTSSRRVNAVQQNGVHTQHSEEEDRPSTSTRSVVVASNSAGRDRRASLQARPSSAPNGIAESSQEDSETDKVRRRPAPLLQRAKSEFGARGEDPDAEEEIQDWGARHGFEDHYASEEYVSQLANVSHKISFV